MNEINTSFLNPVKNRFLPLPRSAVEELEHEPNISDFNIIKEIGNGSYGKVYLAMHKKTKAKYAIKAIDKLNMNNQQEKTCFNREVEIMYKVDHPNIVKLYSHFEDSKYCYLIMQYIPNGSAYDLMKKSANKPNLELIASITRDIIHAIYYLHNMTPTIMHRDIKPENILLDENNNAYLSDFGWSNYIINHRRRNTICGTPIYYSPEMVDDIDHDERVDIWSIGVLLFELNTGKIPFRGNDIDTVKQNISELNITWPNNIDPDIKDLCSKLLKTNPNQRPGIENILEHKFFRKYIASGNSEKKLIKPKKTKNKIFVINKDVPNSNCELKNITNKNIIKIFYNSERNSYKKSDDINENKEKINNDSKLPQPQKKGRNEIHKENYVNNVKYGIKRNLTRSTNKDKIDNINRFKNNNHSFYNRTVVSSKQLDKYINNRPNPYSYSFCGDYNKTDENKSNNYISYNPIYTKQFYNSKASYTNHKSTNKNNYDKHINNNKVETIQKEIIDKNSRLRNKITYKRIHKSSKMQTIYTFNNSKNDLNKEYNTKRIEHNNLNERNKQYNTYINNVEIMMKNQNRVSKSKYEEEKQKQIDYQTINRGGPRITIQRKKLYL